MVICDAKAYSEPVNLLPEESSSQNPLLCTSLNISQSENQICQHVDSSLQKESIISEIVEEIHKNC